MVTTHINAYIAWRKGVVIPKSIVKQIDIRYNPFMFM